MTHQVRKRYTEYLIEKPGVNWSLARCRTVKVRTSGAVLRCSLQTPCSSLNTDVTYPSSTIIHTSFSFASQKRQPIKNGLIAVGHNRLRTGLHFAAS